MTEVTRGRTAKYDEMTITNYVVADGTEEYELLQAMKERAREENNLISRITASVVEDVRRRGMDAVREYSLQFDGAEPREIKKSSMEGALKRIAPELRYALEKSADNMVNYQNRLLSESCVWDSPVEGARVGVLVRPMQKVGVYVPGGSTASPSTVLMNVIPAKVAGVNEIIMVTPPTDNLNDAVLAAAWIAGVDRCIAVGGMQAIAALAYGADYIPKVDKIIGPGNSYVVNAKRIVFGQVDIDMVAGPGELMIIADKTANPRYIAADLLAQAEHDKMASSILLTDTEAFAQEVLAEMERQGKLLERREIVRESLHDFGAVIVFSDIAACIRFADGCAPESVELAVENAKEWAEQLHCVGAVYVGKNTPHMLGEYGAGPSCILPTAGTARFFSPLSVESFVKKTSLVEYSHSGLQQVADIAITLAETERLNAHANALKVRFEG